MARREVRMVVIVGGPSKWDFILGGLCEGKIQRFELSQTIEEEFPDLDKKVLPGHNLFLRISKIETINNEPSQSADNWFFEGYIMQRQAVCPGSSRGKIEGTYDTYFRKGEISVTRIW